MKSKGFTLIELAIVLAIIAVLASILTPIVTSYLDQGRITKATADTKSIADAVRLYHRDTGFYPSFSNLANARTGTTDSKILYGPGTEPDMSQADWTAVQLSSTGLVAKLNTTLAGMAVNQNNPGIASYRGPYLGAVGSDPWGNQYLVTTENLAGATNRGFVISAGVNGRLETAVAQGMAAFTSGGDDITAPVN